MSAPIVIETRGLCKRYGDVEALRGLDLRVPAGLIYGFLGRNGAGKTTTIKALMGLIRPTAGEGRVFGSVARGEATDDGDVDFLVDLEPGRSLFDLGGLLMDLQDLLQRDVDVVTERGLRPRVAERVLADAVEL